MYIDKDWATNITVRETANTPDYEILHVSFRPHYLPREFTQVSVILVYVPGSNNNAAADHIADCYNSVLARSTDQPVILLGDFNTCDITKHLPQLQQCVTKPTHSKGKVLDKFFVNIIDSYTDCYSAPLGMSDHCVIHLLPKYRQLVKREGPKTRIIRKWDHDTAETMRGCFEGTNWDIFYENEDDLDTITDSITSYICFCEENIVQTKRIKVYANSKPWVNGELKTNLLEKRKAFLEGDEQKQHELEKEFKWKNKQSRRQYKDKVEKKLTEGQGRAAWDGLNTMMGKNTKKQELKCDDPLTFANDLNVFYSRFDCTDFSREIDDVCQPLLTIPNNIRVTESDVKKVFSQLKPRKACGPDWVGGKVLRECSSSLSSVFCNLF